MLSFNDFNELIMAHKDYEKHVFELDAVCERNNHLCISSSGISFIWQLSHYWSNPTAQLMEHRTPPTTSVAQTLEIQFQPSSSRTGRDQNQNASTSKCSAGGTGWPHTLRAVNSPDLYRSDAASMLVLVPHLYHHLSVYETEGVRQYACFRDACETRSVDVWRPPVVRVRDGKKIVPWQCSNKLGSFGTICHLWMVGNGYWWVDFIPLFFRSLLEDVIITPRFF